MEILNLIITKIIGNPTVTLGLVALIGLLIQKKKGSDILLGTVKVMLGLAILMGGAGMITGALEPLTALIRKVLNVDGVIPLYWPVYSETMVKFGREVAFTFIIGFVLNLILARATKLRFLSLTVHLQLFWAGFIVIVLNGFGFTGVSFGAWRV